MTDSVCFSFHYNAQCDKKYGSYNVIKQDKKNNYDADDYNGDDDNYKKDKYDSYNNYDGKCTSEERDECCNASEKKQEEICAKSGCNPIKVSTTLSLA